MRRMPAIIAASLIAALLTVCHVLRFSPQPSSLLGDRMQQGFPRWAKNRDGMMTMDTNPLDHSLWRQDTQAPFLPHLSIYTGRGVDRKSASLENVRLLLNVPKTFRARPWTGGYFVSDLEGPQMRFLYRTHNSILVVPPMSHAVGAVSDEAATFLTAFLNKPSNAIMVLGSFQGVFFMNENIALEDGSALSLKAVPAIGPCELQDNVLGTMWEHAPMALPCPDNKGCVGVSLESLPQQAIVLYATPHSASVFAIPLGNGGIILYVGFDFDSSFSQVPPAWAAVLQVAKRYISRMTSSSPRLHSPGYTAYLQQKEADAQTARAARAQHAAFLKRADAAKAQKKSAHAAVAKTAPLSHKPHSGVHAKSITHNAHHDAGHSAQHHAHAAAATHHADHHASASHHAGHHASASHHAGHHASASHHADHHASASSKDKSHSKAKSSDKTTHGRAASQLGSHVELGQMRARFSELHSEAFHLRELASSHFSHVAASLEKRSRSDAASWVQLFDDAVVKAHAASAAAITLSKKIVRHSIGAVTTHRNAFLAARKARRVALHEYTKARARLSRGFYDRKMGYPVSVPFHAVLVPRCPALQHYPPFISPPSQDNISSLRAAVHKYRLRFRQAEDHYAQASVSSLCHALSLPCGSF